MDNPYKKTYGYPSLTSIINVNCQSVNLENKKEGNPYQQCANEENMNKKHIKNTQNKETKNKKNNNNNYKEKTKNRSLKVLNNQLNCSRFLNQNTSYKINKNKNKNMMKKIKKIPKTIQFNSPLLGEKNWMILNKNKENKFWPTQDAGVMRHAR